MTRRVVAYRTSVSAGGLPHAPRPHASARIDRPPSKLLQRRSAAPSTVPFVEEFLRRCGSSLQFLELFRALPEVFYFIKDREFRYVSVSEGIARRVGLAKASDLIGLRTTEVHSPELAAQFAADDQRLLASGEPLLNLVEPWPTEHGGLDWCVTSKFPVRDSSGEIIGIMGVIRPHDRMEHTWAGDASLGKAVDYIRRHHRGPITIAEIVRAAGLSQRSLHRRFREIFGLSTQEFIIRTRVESAGEALLQTAQNVAEIATECGFCDQSALAKAFRAHTGLAPLEYRRRYTGCPPAGVGRVREVGR